MCGLRWACNILVAVLLFTTSCQESESNGINSDADEELSGGTTTSFDFTARAFAQPIAGITATELQSHRDGDFLFGTSFVAPPATVNGGLGPLFNNLSCVSCHVSDGRAIAPTSTEEFGGLLFRVSSASGNDEHGGPLAVPGFGLQIQPHSVAGTVPEMQIKIEYQEVSGQFDDGTAYSLRKPTYTPYQSYQQFPADMLISPRIANANFGLGLLEAVSDETILSMVDEADANGDGISGKANWVYDVVTGKNMLGRFGWKASQPGLLQQSAAAAHGDMGVTSIYFSSEESAGQVQDVPSHPPELTLEQLQAIEVYLKTLAPPARRNVSQSVVQQGRLIFMNLNCDGCHRMKMQTGTSTIAVLSNQTIRPFTDLLLHDMGEGLADGRPDFLATGREWRTAPLWGVGLINVVNGHTNLLHDGRARNLTEAILWHGGEASSSQQKFKALSASDRAALIKFLESL